MKNSQEDCKKRNGINRANIKVLELIIRLRQLIYCLGKNVKRFKNYNKILENSNLFGNSELCLNYASIKSCEKLLGRITRDKLLEAQL